MSKRARHQARFKAVQALYQWDFGNHSASQLLAQFAMDDGLADADAELFERFVRGVCDEQQNLDALIEQHIDRPLEALDTVEHSVLRLALFELKAMPETPYKVVINEAVELSKVFGAEGGHKYINGVLDRCVPSLRPIECASRE